MNRAREQLRAQVGALAVAGASRILGKAVDAGAHRELVDQLAAEL
jgi:F-type H+-transporting ATPase subunit b